MSLLRIEDLNIYFKRADSEDSVHAVKSLSLELNAGECLAIVGESGCGKSTVLSGVLRLLGANAQQQGNIFFRDNNIAQASEKTLRNIRGKEIAMIFQDPMSSLNPTMKVGAQIAEALPREKKLSQKEKLEQVLELLKMTGLSDPEIRAQQYPFELSGGMLQRVAIAMALAGEPCLMMADEPTTALDVSIQKQVLNIIKKLQVEHHLALLLVTHDLGIVAEMADKVLVMYAGEMVEYADVDSILNRPKHPYTQALLASLPVFSREARKTELKPIEGQPPDLSKANQGCAFVDRCEFAMNICAREKPLPENKNNSLLRCWLPFKEQR